MGAMAASLIAGAAWAQAPDNVLTGVARDFEELKWKQATGGHPDFNPTWNTHVTWDPNGAEGWGCFDKPEAAKGAVQPAPVTSDPNPDKLAGFVPYDRDEVGPALKAGYDTPPNCFRSRFGEWYTTRTPDINRAFFVDLPFVKEGSVYKYDNSEFFPLDDDKRAALRPQVPSVTTTFGHRQTGVSEGIDLSKHNYGFTFEFHAKFAYHKSTGQNFAFREALQGARPVLLEPIHELEIRVPEEFVGRVVGDLSGRRGRILGMDVAGRLQVVRAQVPAAQLYHYGTVLRSLTGGRGLHNEKFAHYEEMPADQEKILVGEYQKARAAGTANHAH